MTNWRRCWSGLILSALSLALAFGVGEWVARHRPDWYETGFVPSRVPALIYELQPGFRLRAHGAVINRAGMNDRDFPVVKPPGMRRIAVVGDSVAFGYLLSPAASFPKVLERMLREAGWRQWEVLNFSVPGYNLAQERALIEARVLRYQPDLVLLVYAGNDTFLPNLIPPRGGPQTWLFHGSYLLHTAALRVDQALGPSHRMWAGVKRWGLGMAYPQQRIFPTPGLEEVAYGPDGNPPGKAEDVPRALRHMIGPVRYAENLAAVRDLLTSRRIMLLSTGVMDPQWLAIHRCLWVEHTIEGMISAYQLRQEGRDPSTLYLPDGGHFTEEGHRVAARVVYDYLVRKELLGRR